MDLGKNKQNYQNVRKRKATKDMTHSLRPCVHVMVFIAFINEFTAAKSNRINLAVYRRVLYAVSYCVILNSICLNSNLALWTEKTTANNWLAPKLCTWVKGNNSLYQQVAYVCILKWKVEDRTAHISMFTVCNQYQ